jgi:hypothetical protein
MPVAILDPESLISGSLNDLAELLAPARLGLARGGPAAADFGREGIRA